MLKCLAIDDEPLALELLEDNISQVPYLKLVAACNNPIEAMKILQHEDVDLIFLDIQMPGLTGLQFIKTISSKPMFILITAYEKYALQGYELDIIDYLLKPIAFSRFLKAVQKAKEYYDLKQAPLPQPQASYLFVRSEKRIEKIEWKDILYIESLGNYVNIYTDSKKIIAYLTLKGLEGQLPANEFIKTHQSFLVNISRINAIEGNTIKINNLTLPVSRNYRDTLMQLVEQRLLKR